ncbi:hypothetical protein IAE37_005340 [Pseudomonas sp. S31]|uniref:hypothetical protein n=1 Tax=Pseudomonas sp. S31 TaxID=1564473 RepID=UPI001912F7CF|nr:hypothetical protein [Pseudomonas sp. S31]MBK5003064.1 hypothetical protein [Pseudomonas sp. S31]
MAGRLHRFLAGCALLQALAAPHAGAIEVDVTARYRADPSGKFENTTPKAVFCARFRFNCEGDRHAFDIPITYTKTVTVLAPDVRDRFYLKLPSRRSVEVSNDQGERYMLTIDFTFVSQRATEISGNPGHAASGPRGGCSAVSMSAGFQYFAFLWRVRDITDPCHASGVGTGGEVITVGVDEVGVATHLIIPPPSGMPKGIYRGRVDYSVGDGGDFDFGSHVTDLSDNVVTFNLELDVSHDLFMRFPPGSERAVLEPPGGWQSYLAGRSAPQRLSRDIPFTLWNTGPLQIYKQCQYDQGTLCAIRDSNGRGQQVPIQVALTLPGQLVHGGQPIERLAIPTGEAAALDIVARDVVWNRPGTLHFEVGSQDLPAMLARPGSRYEGLVTVMFDADL